MTYSGTDLQCITGIVLGSGYTAGTGTLVSDAKMSNLIGCI